jgi:hypothetical protein
MPPTTTQKSISQEVSDGNKALATAQYFAFLSLDYITPRAVYVARKLFFLNQVMKT